MAEQEREGDQPETQTVEGGDTPESSDPEPSSEPGDDD